MELYRSLNPATDELFDEFASATPDAVENTLEAASRGFRNWSSTSLDMRSKLLARAAEILDQRKDECARAMSLEMGKPIGEAGTEVARCADACRYFAENGAELLRPERRPAGDGIGEILFQPIGPLLAIMPWNFPFWQVFRCAAPGIFSGNTVILKHAPNTPGCARLIEAIFREAGAPEGVFQNSFLTNDQAARVIGDRRIAGVSLTGSVRAGKEVGRLAGEHLKRCVLELGGSDPFIVFGDADFEATVKAAVSFRCFNNGQSCISPKRIFIEYSIWTKFTAAFAEGMKKRVVGDPLDPKTECGPMARADLRGNLAHQVKQSVSQGAKLLCGGEEMPGKGFFFSPAALVDVAADNIARREELFGPVGVLIPFHSETDLVQMANDSDYGLGASIWTGDAERAGKLAAQLESGNVFINSNTRSIPALPFGGVKHSGIGRELGREGIREFVNVKTVWRKA